MHQYLWLLLVCTLPLLADKYDGPRPGKPDLPYLVHADNLVPTESAEARQENTKNEITYIVDGATSSVRTPLASPIFLFQSDQIPADHLQLYRFESKGGQRHVLFSRKRKQLARPIRLNVTRLDENLYRVEVDEILENGEYALTPQDSNQVFCFQIY
jgi:hypothetical protein